MYKLNKHVVAFTGLVRATIGVPFNGSAQLTVATPCRGGDVEASSFLEQPTDVYGAGIASELRGPTTNYWQFGLVGNTEIAKKTNLYGIVGLGSGYTNWEAGVGYEIAKNVEFNVNYRATKYDRLKLANVSWVNQHYVGDQLIEDNSGSTDISAKDLEVKGWGFGVTFKF